MTVPNALSSFRLGLVPVLLPLAWLQYELTFVSLIVLALFLDLIDGPIARWLNQVTELGPILDSWADFAIYITFLIGACWLWPETVWRERAYLIVGAACIILPALIGFIKFRQGTSYHTWLVKFAVVCISPSILLLFLGGPAWPFHIAIVICALAAIEETAITLIMDKPRSDVRSLWHILKQRDSDSPS